MAKGAFASQVTEPERDEALIHERLEIYRAIIAGNLAEGFTQMPDQVREDPFLSRAAKLVYEQLLRYTRQKDFCWPSQQRIADDLVTISRSTVIRALNELYERGYIEKWRRGLNRTNIYYINPLFFPGSFKRPWRGRGVLPEAHSPEIYVSVHDTPQPDLLRSLSGKFQNDTSRSSKTEHQDASNWNSKHTESNETKNETNSDESRIRRGSAAPEKGMDSPSSPPACSHIAHGAIGNEQTTSDTNTHESRNLEQQGDRFASVETSNQSKAEETGRPARAKEVEEEKTSKKPRTFEEMAALVGIAPENLQAMKDWLKACPRPEVTPLKLQGIIPMWSRELGNAEPPLIAANVTQASKLYKYARINGLSQEAAESCFEHARQAVRNHPEVVKKMAFFFTSLKLDILVALKQNRDLPASWSLVPPSIPDGYDEDLPGEEMSVKGSSAEAEVAPPATGAHASRKQPPEPESTVPVVEPIELPPDHPRPEWKTWEAANWWGERLRDELDPARQFSWYEVRPTENGCYGFVFFLREQADPIWEELLAGGYVTSAVAKQSLEAIRAVRGPRERKSGKR